MYKQDIFPVRAAQASRAGGVLYVHSFVADRYSKLTGKFFELI